MNISELLSIVGVCGIEYFIDVSKLLSIMGVCGIEYFIDVSKPLLSILGVYNICDICRRYSGDR
jgi:hypothetical protein